MLAKDSGVRHGVLLSWFAVAAHGKGGGNSAWERSKRAAGVLVLGRP